MTNAGDFNKVWSEASLPATCGELVQGTLDGFPCLVSCPIDRFSTARIRLKPDPGWQMPKNASKSASAVYNVIEFFGCEQVGGDLSLDSDIPRGRGYGSSTADIGATLFSLAQALQQPLLPEEAARLAVRIEPSDSTLFPGLALFNHLNGSFHENLGSVPPLPVLVFDPGGEVDTLAYNQQDHGDKLKTMAEQHRTAFRMLHQGLLNKDWEAVGEAASLSARLHQSILYNPFLERIDFLAKEVQALGICRAHSGTILGILFNPITTDIHHVSKFLQEKIPENINITCHKMTDGGPRFCEIQN